ncbi:MAG: TIGR04255 family protein [Anaerolineae bacterium]
MGERLLSPPLIEALCEFRFTPSTSWDWTLPGRLYERISKEFPERSQLDAIAVQFELGARSAAPSEFIRGPERVQMKRVDGSAMVQVGANLLAINHFRPYPTWEGFRTLIMSTLDNYLILAESAGFVRIGLRYINRLPISAGYFRVNSTITVAPSLAGELDRPIQAFYQRYELAYDAPKGILIHQTGMLEDDLGRGILLDLDFGSTEPPSVTVGESLETWLDEAHTRIYDAFVASLVPEVYEQLLRGEP